ncbi:PAS domain-containing sensor histidine kinase [Bacillus pseudomycoides]|uniref:ATP-binding protein n=1 Tax=Bacillus pseudomycoides TaxID=64104 RepID=UPI000BEDA1ED|nr:ATP-binding protein [Bacillus pseudomycoides]PDX99671.1 PAS domain-containing sensor histidine kinase [Bacillus pseudomycoides]PEK82368.1 PAS domain-containing sensor histidine kinase [Bacillus pseudomycoides]PEN10043.1 PAS domain-containing sensor histidine kinase [Bacillus pseudomycoides]PGB88346.1 PAS domain-containing sensor histidine kinase [Bacillus pseudomycoides]PHE56856.1 PAS domain-containing sensor histidine kinase [Bacillus pseudomycoides]
MIQEDTTLSHEKQIKELERKVQFYEQLVNQLPHHFTYKNSQLGLQLHKKGTSHSINRIPKQERESNLVLTCDSLFLFEQLEKHFVHIFDAFSHHVTFIDNKGIITLCNQSAVDNLGISRRDIIGKPIQQLLNLPEEKIKALETLRSGKEIYNEEVLDTNYGISNNRIIRHYNGEIFRVISVFHYLNTERDAEKLALAGRIAAGIAHEVRNPLTTVRGYLQFLQESVSPSNKELFQNLLIPELDRANSIITKFLSISKAHEFKREPFPINTFLREYIQQLLASEVFLHNISIEYNLSSDLEDILVNIDRHELVQVFLNLFQNAVDAKSDKPLSIQITSHRLDNFARITFQDNGTGIPPAIQDYIFDPFFSTKDAGTGLGLSVTRKIIQNHNGTLKVSSNENGTTFIISIPLAQKGAGL